MKLKDYIFVPLALFLTACEPIVSDVPDYLNRAFKWEVNVTAEDGISYSTTITIGKDTIINNQTYRLVGGYYPMRQKTKSIYLYDYRTKKDILLYNFALHAGNSIELIDDPFSGTLNRKAKVLKTDIISLVDGREACRIEYERIFPKHIDIEFVGDAERGILGPLDNSLCKHTLVSFYENDKLIYSPSH